MKLFKTKNSILVQSNESFYEVSKATDLNKAWDDLFNQKDLINSLKNQIESGSLKTTKAPQQQDLVAPIGTQEVWAAGVTYFRSRTARMEESKDAGGGSFYDKVYSAERPELFMKATPHRVSGTGGEVKIRKDSKWNVPEPELTVAVNTRGEIIGYTIGNDMSSRDIEGENPLYLPQAKVYDKCCGLGPCVFLTDKTLPTETKIQIAIVREKEPVFQGETTLAQLKRTPSELAGFLFRDNSFPTGTFLLTGTGIVPPDEFTLQSADEIRIMVGEIGELVNVVR